jgi:hypothetical protein
MRPLRTIANAIADEYKIESPNLKVWTRKIIFFCFFYYRTLNRHRFIGRVYLGVELKVVKELGNITCKVFWENTNVGETIKLRGHPKTFYTKLYPQGYMWLN